MRRQTSFPDIRFIDDNRSTRNSDLTGQMVEHALFGHFLHGFTALRNSFPSAFLKRKKHKRDKGTPGIYHTIKFALFAFIFYSANLFVAPLLRPFSLYICIHSVRNLFVPSLRRESVRVYAWCVQLLLRDPRHLNSQQQHQKKNTIHTWVKKGHTKLGVHMTGWLRSQHTVNSKME